MSGWTRRRFAVPVVAGLALLLTAWGAAAAGWRAVGGDRLAFDVAGDPELRRDERTGALEIVLAPDEAPDPAELVALYRGYLADVRRDPDGRRIVLRPAPGVVIRDRRIRRAGRTELLLLFELEQSAGPPPIAVRTGVHPDFERVVFDGDGAAQARATSRAGYVDVELEGSLAPGAEGAITALSRVQAAERLSEGRLRLRLAAGVAARITRLPPDRLVIDLLAGERGELPSGEATAARPPAPVANAAAAPHVTAAPPPAAQTVAPATPAPGEMTATEAQAADGAADSVLSAGEESAAPAAVAAVAVTPLRSGGDVGLHFSWPPAVGAAAYLRSGRIWVVFDATAERFELDRAGVAATLGERLRRLRTYGRELASLVELELAEPHWPEMRRSAGGWELWLRPRPPDLPARLELDAGRRALVLDAPARVLSFRDPVVGDDLTVLVTRREIAGEPRGRKLVDLEILPSLQGLAWRARDPGVTVATDSGRTVVTRPGGLRVDRPAAEPRPSARTPVATGKPAKRTAFAGDLPEPAPPAGRGAAPAPASVETATAESEPPQAETEPARTTPAETELAESTADAPPAAVAGEPRPEVAEPTDAAVTTATGGTEADPPDGAETLQTLDLPPWNTPLGLSELADTDVATRRNLQVRILARLAAAQGEQRDLLVLESARLYLAEAFGEETLTALRTISEMAIGAAPETAVDRRALLAGAALALRGDIEAAAKLLGAAAFDELPEIDLWRGVIAAAAGRWDDAARAFEEGEQWLRDYPEPLHFRLGITAVMVALQAGRADQAYVWLDRLARMQLGPREREQLRFVEAMTLARDGADEEADAILAELAAEAGWDIATKAAYTRVDLGRESGRLDAARARAELEPQRPLWRGHPWEPTMLAGLGRLREATADVGGALAIWREAIDRYPDDPAVAALPSEMRRLVAAVLDPERPPDLPPLAALALYRDYAELVPGGSEGARIARHLAAALTRLGLERPARALLLERAAAADGPVARQLRLEAARLAIEGGEPHQALEELAALAAEAVPQADRRRLTARALLALGRPADAIAALDGLEDRDANRLRADAAWQLRAPDRLAALTDRFRPLPADGFEQPEDALRLTRILWALAETDPARAQAFGSELAGLIDDPVLRAIAGLLAPAKPLRGTAPEVAAQARERAAHARQLLMESRGARLHAALETPPTGGAP